VGHPRPVRRAVRRDDCPAPADPDPALALGADGHDHFSKPETGQDARKRTRPAGQ
jgi:hypothetical protein